jgi:hypothetical protein
MKLLAGILTVVSGVAFANTSHAMDAGNCSKTVIRAAYQAAVQAASTFPQALNLHLAGSFQRGPGETEVSFYDYPYEITVDVFFDHNCRITGVEERDNSRTISGGGA